MADLGHCGHCGGPLDWQNGDPSSRTVTCTRCQPYFTLLLKNAQLIAESLSRVERDVGSANHRAYRGGRGLAETITALSIARDLNAAALELEMNAEALCAVSGKFLRTEENAERERVIE